MYRDLKGTEEGRNLIEESEARLGDYFEESKMREDNGDRDHEIEEKTKEQAEAGGAAPAAAPVGPLANGTSSSSAPRSVPEPRVLGSDSRPKGTEKKTKISSSDTSNVQKRPMGPRGR